MSSRLLICVGGQFGSEGKGHVCAQLSRDLAPNSLVIRTGGPNAGHTVIDHEGREFKFRHLPTPVVVRDDIIVALAARSVIDPQVLDHEIRNVAASGYAFPFVIDPAATILTPDHVDEEENTGAMHEIGSTRKGIGAARRARVARVAQTARDFFPQPLLQDVAQLAMITLEQGGDVLIEAAQGYGLGLHTRFYPTCTSADCTALDALADCRLSPWALPSPPEVWQVMRPYPIRVAGTSGPLEGETTWQDLGLPEERTTVTNKVRRVGIWDSALAKEATLANGGKVKIALTMVDQVIPAVKGMDDELGFVDRLDHDDAFAATVYDLLQTVRSDCLGQPILALGTGPSTMLFADRIGAHSW